VLLGELPPDITFQRGKASMSRERFQSTGKTSFYGDYLYEQIIPPNHFLRKCPVWGTSCGRWYTSFVASLKGWLEGDRQAMSELGEATPVKHWLAGILPYKLELLERHGNLGRLTGARRPGRSGTRRI